MRYYISVNVRPRYEDYEQEVYITASTIEGLAAEVNQLEAEDEINRQYDEPLVFDLTQVCKRDDVTVDELKVLNDTVLARRRAVEQERERKKKEDRFSRDIATRRGNITRLKNNLHRMKGDLNPDAIKRHEEAIAVLEKELEDFTQRGPHGL